MTPGKMTKSFATILLIAGLVVGCSKRTPNFKENDFIDKEKILLKPDHENHDATNLEGGEKADVIPLSSAEQEEQKILENAKADIIPGVGAANITFASTIAHTVEVLSIPSYISDEIDTDLLTYLWIYEEGLYIDWGDRDQQSKPQRIRLTDEYKGGFEIPGFGYTIMNETELIAVNSNPALQKDYLNAMYKAYFDSSFDIEENDCLAIEKCVVYDKNGTKAWLFPGGATYGDAIFFFDDDFNKITFVMMYTATPQIPKEVEANISLPILLTEGAAGIDFSMTKEETLDNLYDTVKDINEDGVTYSFHEQIQVTFGVNAEEGEKPQMIRISKGYKGALNVPGIGDVFVGQDLTPYMTDINEFYAVMGAFYNQTYGKDADYNCYEIGECGWYDEEKGYFVFAVNSNITVVFFMGAAKDTFQELLIFTPTPETVVEAPVEEPTPEQPANGGNNEQPATEEPATQEPAVNLPAYATAPIVLGVSAAGVNWSTTFEQASSFLIEIPQTAAYKVYQGGVVIQWTGSEATATPSIIYLNGEHRGAFTVPGYGAIAIGSDIASFIPADQGEEGMVNFVKAAYRVAIAGTAADYDCVAAETCYLQQASNQYYELYLGEFIRIDIDPTFTTIAGILMVSPTLQAEAPAPVIEEETPVVEEEPVVVAPVEVPDYASLPILPGIGVAGITFDTLEENANLEFVPADTGDATVKLYNGGVVVKWGADSKPEVMLIFGGYNGYEGALEVPGYPAAVFGQPLEQIIGVATMDAISAYFSAVYNMAHEVAEGYSCFAAEPATCGFSQDESGNLIFIAGEKLHVYLAPDGSTMTQIMMFAPQPANK